MVKGHRPYFYIYIYNMEYSHCKTDIALLMLDPSLFFGNKILKLDKRYSFVPILSLITDLQVSYHRDSLVD